MANGRVGVNPTLLEEKIGQLRALAVICTETGNDFPLSKGPCREEMVLFDKEFTQNAYRCLQELMNATIGYLEYAKADLEGQ